MQWLETCKCQLTQEFSVRRFPVAGKPLREESQQRGDERREGGDHDEPEPPGAQPTLVTLPEITLKARHHVQPETHAANMRGECSEH